MNKVFQIQSKLVSFSHIRLIKLFLLTLFFFFLQCSTAPVREFPSLDYSSILNTKEYSPASPKYLPPILIFEPVLLTESALYRMEKNTEKGLIAYLNKEGYTVYYISSMDNVSNIKDKALELNSIVNQISKKHNNIDVILAGVSLGGQTILEYMTLPVDLSLTGKVKKIFFIGTGIDYNYTNSFAEKSKAFGYENKQIKDLCPKSKKKNFCTKYIRFNNDLQKVDNSQKEQYFAKVPKIENNFISRFHKTKLNLSYFFLYGKLDSISPEETIQVFFNTIRPLEKGDIRNTLYEAGEANGQTKDYDHADLFVYEKADKEIYPELLDWLKKE